MKTLTIPEAKQIAIDIAKQINPADNREFFLIHSEKVAKVAKMIAKKIGIDTEVFEIAGRVHDIGYAKDIEHHSDFSLSILEELGYEINDILKDCILNHGNKKTPKTKEGKIIQIADKMSIFDYDIIELMLKYGPFPFNDEDMTLIKKMSEGAIKLIENYSN